MAETISSVVEDIVKQFGDDTAIPDLDKKLKRLGCLMRKADVEGNSKDADAGIKRLKLSQVVNPDLKDNQKKIQKTLKSFISKHSKKMWRFKNVYSKKCAKMGIETGGKGVLGNLKDAGAGAIDAAKKKVEDMKKKAAAKKAAEKKAAEKKATKFAKLKY
jgi:hypothetical protein